MTDQATWTDDGSRKRALAFVIPCYVIATFLWDLLVPAHEYPMRAEQVVSIGFDLIAFVGLLALRPHVVKPLFWTALAAGLGVFAIRVSGDASWWTGHLVYTIPPR